MCLFFSSKLMSATPQLWFSDKPPNRDMTKNMSMRHGGYVHVENGVDVKQLWLRQGNSLNKSTYLGSAEGEYLVLDVQKHSSQPKIEKASQQSILFSMPDEGFYNAYYIDRLLNQDTLTVRTAKAEVLSHNCRNGHKYDRKLVTPQSWGAAPLDIVRLRIPKEDFHTRIHSGTDIKFKILHYGKPLSGASVTLETNKGWIKKTESDDQGIAHFQIIQDNFFDTKKAEKAGKKIARGHGGRIRFKDNYLLTAEYLTPESGFKDDKPYHSTEYVTSTTGCYYPQQFISQSSEEALYFVSAGMLVMGVGGYSYRKRREKPFKEETFGEH